MKILMINGSMRKGTTYHIAKMFLEKFISEEDLIAEAFLPKELPEFCRGCYKCMHEGEDKCPDYLIYTKRLTEALKAADLLVFTTPTYGMHTSGQMKAFLDHYAYLWMPHRPMKEMFTKQAIIFSTSAGMGHKSAIKDIKDSLKFWGVGRIHQFGIDVGVSQWSDVDEELMKVLDSKTSSLVSKINKNPNSVTPSLTSKAIFYMIRMLHKNQLTLPADKKYWEEKGWLKKQRPWQKTRHSIKQNKN